MLSFFNSEYTNIGIYALVCGGLALIILFLSYTLSIIYPDTEKLSTYECGFDPYEDARNAFDVRFYLVAILFIIFDIETVFLFPWAASLAWLPSLGIWCMFDFFIELCLGFVYAWKVGALEWE
jgi:NADH-quinone oxidoreductase subunit A